jgi:hypothetical protein
MTFNITLSVLSVVILSVATLNVIIRSVIILNAVMLSVVASLVGIDQISWMLERLFPCWQTVHADRTFFNKRTCRSIRPNKARQTQE